jgi:FMN phosphatase YigB (HAD superfamily)
MIKAILFDLDGTLLPMDQDKHLKTYFKHLSAYMMPYGYEPSEFINNMMKSTYLMLKNDGSDTNENIFWNSFAEIYGDKVKKDRLVVDSFYKNAYQPVRAVCGFNPEAASTVRRLKDRGYTVVLATSPLFPRVAVEGRLGWAGLDISDFDEVTTYENSHCTKPSSGYYREICERLSLKPEECLMVGNDASDDMPAQNTGMKVFLITDCLINAKCEDISKYPQGSFKELIEYIDSL